MASVDRRVKNLPAPRRTIDRRIVGTPEYVRNTIQLATATGRLVHVSPWQETPEGVQVVVRLIPREEPATTARPVRRRWQAVTAVAAGGVALAGAAAYAVVRIVDAVITLLPAIVGGLLLLALVAVVVSAVSAGRSRTFSGTFKGRMD